MMNLEGKKTYLGLLTALIGQLLQLAGIDPMAAVGVDAEGVANSALILIGVGIAVYGRFVAKPKAAPQGEKAP